MNLRIGDEIVRIAGYRSIFWRESYPFIKINMNKKQKLEFYRNNKEFAIEYLRATYKPCDGEEIINILKKYSMSPFSVCNYCIFSGEYCGSGSIEDRKIEGEKIIASLIPKQIKEI